MFAICHRRFVCLSVCPSVVCLSSVTLVHPTQAIEIFGNISTPCGTLAITISRKRCKIGAKFVLITNRKSHTGFRLVPNSVTLDDPERRNSPIRSVISPNSVDFGTDCVKVVEDTPILSVA